MVQGPNPKFGQHLPVGGKRQWFGRPGQRKESHPVEIVARR
jgi:hypothetical protein